MYPIQFLLSLFAHLSWVVAWLLKLPYLFHSTSVLHYPLTHHPHKQEYACEKVRELGLIPGEAIDAAVLEGKKYPHLEAMRYRLRLLQTLVCVTSRVITQPQVRVRGGPRHHLFVDS